MCVCVCVCVCVKGQGNPLHPRSWHICNQEGVRGLPGTCNPLHCAQPVSYLHAFNGMDEDGTDWLIVVGCQIISLVSLRGCVGSTWDPPTKPQGWKYNIFFLCLLI